MKYILFSFLLLLQCRVSAKEFPPTLAYETISATIWTSLSVSNATANPETSLAFDVEKSVYHTFQFITTATNLSTTVLQRSLDGTNWASVFTNAPTSTNVVDTTFIGKWKYYRATMIGTNATVVIKYLGQ